MQTYHIDRMRLLQHGGWVNMEKVAGVWHYELTEGARVTLGEHIRYAHGKVVFNMEPAF